MENGPDKNLKQILVVEDEPFIIFVAL